MKKTHNLNKQSNKQAIFLMGPTAAGKTDLVISLAQKFPIEIISVDSGMIYKEMDIGTGKPSIEELQIAPHNLIDIISPLESYSAADFCNDAIALMNNAFLNNKVPILVGGTMMYFNALKKGLSNLPSCDANLRDELLKEAKIKGWKYLHEKLENLDYETANRIHPNDPQRIQRALEIIITTGKTMTELLQEKLTFLDGWNIKEIAIAPKNRETLHKRIEARFYAMLEQGIIAEVQMLLDKYNLDLNYPSMRSVGYRQIINYLQKNYSYDEMIEKAVIATRQLAKRQYTWLRSFESVEWVDSEDKNLLKKFSNYLYFSL